MSILIKEVLLNNKRKDIYIEDNSFTEISDNIKCKAEYKIDGKNKAILPSFFNCHTHAAMSLLKGYADDLPLQDWLSKVWPVEEKFKEKGVYLGTKLAILEMIKSGTTFFNDMYWHLDSAKKAIDEMKVRACFASVFIDGLPIPKLPKDSELIKFAYGPHAIYTVNKENLIKIKELAEKNNRPIHIHLSETKKEVDDCFKKHKKRPVEYLNSFNFLNKNVFAAHGVWFDDKEIEILAKTKTNVIYNPVSNAKLASGILNFQKLNNVNVLLGTDGSASNNNLNMFEEMKFAALLQKANNLNPTLLPANQIHNIATEQAAKTFNINAGKIKEGKLADFILVDLKNISLFPNHNLISNLVYSANPECIMHTVCNGKILMNNKIIEEEEEIKEQAKTFINTLF